MQKNEKLEIKLLLYQMNGTTNFIGEITESNNAIDYKKQRYTIYFDNDDTIEHDVTLSLYNQQNQFENSDDDD